MLVIPVSRSPDWRHPPLITLLLILINTLIFFGLQSGDEQREARARQYYAASTLPQLELPRYIRHLEETGQSRQAAQATKALENKRWWRLQYAMEADEGFMKRLRAGQIITPSDSDYASWQRQRNEYDRLQSRSIVERFGFKPAAPTLSGLIGHMFLHGSFDHLLGNMAILFIVGYLVEETLGKRRYLLFYLISGIGAAGFDWLFNGDRLAPGIGASGALSGVMAMFVALYGLQKIRFFYWAFVYFDFFKAPAIIVLPFWMANELYQYFFNHGSHINYMAHFGGLATGATLIAAQRWLSKKPMAAPKQEAAIDPLPGQLARIDALLGALKIDDARQSLRKLAEARPQDIGILNRYYKVARNAPANDDYHHAAALIFGLPDEHPGSAELIHETFLDYLKLAKPSVRFSVRQLITLIRRLARAGHTDDAERLTRVLGRRAPEDRHLPGLILLVAETYRKAGNGPMKDALITRLHTEFPDSEEARMTKLLGH